MGYGIATAPEATKVQVDRLTQLLREAFGASLLGVVLHGSLSTDSFQPERSDLDLLAVVEGAASEEAKRSLALGLLALSGAPHPVDLYVCGASELRTWRQPCRYAFHYAEAWRQRFEAAIAIAGTPDGPDGEAAWRLRALEAFAGGTDDVLAARVRAARDRGVSLHGARREEALPAVPDAVVRAAMYAGADAPFRDVSKRPVDAVLDWLRALRFAADGAVVSKEEAGAWGMLSMPLHIEVVADALKLYRRPEPREALHFDVEPLQAFLRACRARRASF
ncbi:nucleotidyltransferase domain-containing protein [Paenibacillus sp.]|uniref:nucleotidyltransferase domain-containing protein n=1 Tax=Paenibacillus sp. TaxID=58172 RepID=UPI002D38907C|nr:aminoglycoside adenylyltransferase domain-containing protein [Paenibacillus sp.]HZG54895.1 aminoglycoside adenylyltransferase domain-containing protein [Paenibacillus sp.]